MDNVMSVKQISVFVENKQGALLDITTRLSQHQINIRAVSLADTTRFGIFRLIVDKPDECEKALCEEGFTVSITNVLIVKLPDRPGGLSEAVKILSEHGINIDYLYAFITHAIKDTCVIIRVGDIEFAEKVLMDNGFTFYSDEDIAKV